MGKYHWLLVGAQKHLPRPGKLLRGDMQQRRFVQRDTRLPAFHINHGETLAALLYPLRE
jgi:hypothetical protein